MRLGFFSPMPPSKSGIADYSAALLEPLARLHQVEVFDREPAAFDPAAFDLLLYQLGNNPYHEFVYRMALRNPGVVVMHEANLHHLIAGLTIRRDDWDAYLREVEYEGGATALAYARRVRALEVGPDYEGVPMLRRVLESARAVVVHSQCVFDQIRAAGFQGPLARIPHGAWVQTADRWGCRERLGVDESTPLVGIFGFLKPYKRIAESLRAFRRLLRLEPRAKFILAGETHPDFPVQSLIRTLGLAASVRVLGFMPIQDFVAHIAACDVVLNLRYPTVGESSGSLLRAMGLARPVLVSDIGSFRDFPDDVCLKVPVDQTEEDQIFEFLNLLVSRPEAARQIGNRAREWVERECTWELVARKYAAFLESVAAGRPVADLTAVPVADPPTAVVADPPAAASLEPAPPPAPPSPADILEWAPREPVFRAYVDAHLARLTKTLEITPPGTPSDSVLEMGTYLQVAPALRKRLGYGEVRGCYFGKLGVVEHREVASANGERFEMDLELFDAEKDVFPYPDGYFATVLCCELFEHLAVDPMFMMVEVNRILRPGGHLVLTTPNLASLRAISAILQGYNPGLFPQYIRPDDEGKIDPRHSREYTPFEIRLLLRDSGFEVSLLETGPFYEQPRPELVWVRRLLERYEYSTELRDEGIYAVGRKTGPIRSRYPDWLYGGSE
jgi:glycosyltransferase involved in cell wall biosynthesis/SAM-dependent methyltransferase